jgi:hypothetical protein
MMGDEGDRGDQMGFYFTCDFRLCAWSGSLIQLMFKAAF